MLAVQITKYHCHFYILTACKNVNAEFDRGEVTAADLITQLVESNPLSECNLTQTSLVTGQLVRQPLVRRQEALPLRFQDPLSTRSD